MLLSDLGAETIRIERTSGSTFGAWSDPRFDVLGRGRRSVAVDIKHPAGREIILRLVERADALLEGFRPGVAERLGLGPDACWERNQRLVFGRMTGWGQDGPIAKTAGHDIDYIALTGALHAIGDEAQPAVPLNVVGDFGGGALYLALGVVSAVLESRTSGRGQVVDAAMVDGATSLMSAVYGAFAFGFWRDERAANLLDGGAPFYGVYKTADNRFIAVGAIEPAFYEQFISGLGLDVAAVPAQFDRDQWKTTRTRIADVIASRTRDEWCAVFAGTDACIAPVLSLDEAPSHPHLRARATFVDIGGVIQPSPAPRFSRTRNSVPTPASHPGAHTREVLRELGYSEPDVSSLIASGAVVTSAASEETS
jgi:alpha-methylacyl-CoA racemase